MIDFTKPLRTRDGRKVRILCTDRKDGLSVVGLIEENNGHEDVAVWRRDGTFRGGAPKHDCDLANTNEGTFWMNVYSDGPSNRTHPTREAADSWAAGSRLARIKVLWREGQFDE